MKPRPSLPGMKVPSNLKDAPTESRAPHKGVCHKAFPWHGDPS